MTMSPSALDVRVPAAEVPDTGDVLSWIADQLGLGWGFLPGLVLPTLLVLAAGAAMTVVLWRRTRGTPSTTTGAELFAGRVVTVRTADGDHGQAFVEGSWWSIRSGGEPLRVGQDVRISQVEGLVLLVEDLDAGSTKEEDMK